MPFLSNFARMMKRLLVFLMVFCALSTYSLAQNWVGTWATAPQTVVRSFMPYNNCMTNRSVRQVVKVSIGGDVIRLKLSNIYSMQPVEIRSIYIAHAKDSVQHRCQIGTILQVQQQLQDHHSCRQADSERCPEVQAQEPGACSHHHQLHLGSRSAHRAHGFAYHLLYHERCNQCPLQLREGFQREPLVQHQRHRCVYHEQQHECHRHHGQLHHRRQMLYG